MPLLILFNQLQIQRFGIGVGYPDQRAAAWFDNPNYWNFDPNPIQTIGGIESAEAFGLPTYQFVTAVELIGIVSAEAFGDPASRYIETASGIATGELFGDDRQLLSETGTGIASAESFGSAAIKFIEYAAGIASGEAFGSDQQILSETGSGAASGEEFGSAAAQFVEYVASIASEETFGNPALVQASTTILHPVLTGVVPTHVRDDELRKKLKRRFKLIGIPSEEAFGTPNLKLEFDPYDPALIAANNEFLIMQAISSNKGDVRFFYDEHGRIIQILTGILAEDYEDAA